MKTCNSSKDLSLFVHFSLQKVTLRITVAENTTGSGKTPSIGHVLIGPNSKGAPLAHWNQMMMSLRKPVAMWHPLRK